jgi:hypothetical protein
MGPLRGGDDTMPDMRTLCEYPGDRDQAIVSYLYDAAAVDPIERASFDAHLSICEQCRAEVADLRGVRAQLSRWTPPGFARAFADQRDSGDRDARGALARGGVWATLREIPAWAQVAAALLFLGVAAGLANLDVRYGRDGLIVRTGWSRPASAPANPANPTPSASTASFGSADTAPWRADVAALGKQLRGEIQAAQNAMRAAPAAVGTPGAHDAQGTTTLSADTLRRIRSLIDESEHRQQQELALRVADVMRDVNAQRQADLVKIDRSLGFIQTNTGVEVAKQRELLNYLVRVSQKQ